jgi:hypothetical protein
LASPRFALDLIWVGIIDKWIDCHALLLAAQGSLYPERFSFFFFFIACQDWQTGAQLAKDY